MAAQTSRSQVTAMSNSPNSPWTRYEQRIEKVIEYIHQNLEQSLTSEVLADVAHLSPYHWHRIYRAITGESAAATVKRSRLHKAAAELIRTDKAVEDIGVSVGYREVHSFNRTFKAYYGLAPGQFRQMNKAPSNNKTTGSVNSQKNYPVSMEVKPDMHLLGLWHRGDFMDIGSTFEKVMAQCQMHGILPAAPVTVGVYFADPEITDFESLRSFAGVSVGASITAPKGLQHIHYQGGKFACLTHQGPYALLNPTYHWLYGCWLPASGEAVRNQPCCEIYLNTPVNTDPADLLTMICLPVE